MCKTKGWHIKSHKRQRPKAVKESPGIRALYERYLARIVRFPDFRFRISDFRFPISEFFFIKINYFRGTFTIVET